MAWTTAEEIKGLYPHYKKLQNAADAWIENTVLAETEAFILKYVNPPDSEGWADLPPEDVVGVAKEYAVNRILGDDETVRIAQARGQPSYMVSGDTITLDLSLGRNPFLSLQDEAILLGYKAMWDPESHLHTDKVVVKSQGQRYRNAPGGDTDPAGTDYTYPDGPLPGYFRPA